MLLSCIFKISSFEILSDPVTCALAERLTTFYRLHVFSHEKTEKRSLHSDVIFSGPPICTLIKQIGKLTTFKVFIFLFAFLLRM